MTREEAKEVLNTYDMSEDNDDTEFKCAIALAIKALEQQDVLDKIRAEIEKYGSIMGTYVITEDIKTDKGIEKLVSDVLKQAKEQVLDIIDEHKVESEGEKTYGEELADEICKMCF